MEVKKITEFTYMLEDPKRNEDQEEECTLSYEGGREHMGYVI